MAELLFGIATSGIGICGVALQIAATARELQRVCSEQRHARKDLIDLIEVVRVFAGVLTEVGKAARQSPDSVAWDQCQHHSESLLARL